MSTLTLTVGEQGWLRFRTRPVDGHGTIEHHGEYRYVGVEDGMHRFAGVPFGMPLYLHDDEIVAFGHAHSIRFLLVGDTLNAECSCGWECVCEGEHTLPAQAEALLLAALQHREVTP